MKVKLFWSFNFLQFLSISIFYHE